MICRLTESSDMPPGLHHTTVRLSSPRGFNFWRTVYSHGWCDLPPFSHDTERRTLSRVLLLEDGTVVSTLLRSRRKWLAVTVRSARRLAPSHYTEIRRQLAACLRLEDDLSEFYRVARRYPHYRWIAIAGAGRLLRAPTVFEDVVKMICTTNCTWALTKLMVRNLVTCFGSGFDGTIHAFPTPDAIAASTEQYLRSHVKVGYRAPYILQLAERVATGRLNIEAWRTSQHPTEALLKEILSVKGIGPYAAANILKLLGRYEYLGLDSWVRARYSTLYRNGRSVKDRIIEGHYAPYGRWRGLFFWLEMTRYWHEDKFAF